MKAEERIKEIFAQALEKKSPAEREAYLGEACKGEPELRRQVESLLRAHEQAGNFLGQTVPLLTSDFTIERTGMMIGRYKLLQKIGEGGFGVVYMAEQVEPVQRKVALKIIKAGMDTREVVARFEAERQALALMDHPNIARVFDAGATEAGRPYFVMELVNGIPITEFCDHEQLSTTERLRLFMKVCHAVQHAHQKGIIHRDLKPNNVLVTLHDGEPVPKVIDFGVAKALGQKLTEKTLFTAFRDMIGTPAYMSPEQAELSGLDIDTRSDIYSLGVLLYELLTGETPFDAETLRKAALDEVRRMIRETEPPKPSTRLQAMGEKLPDIAKRRQTEPQALRRLVRGDLDWIVMKALEKDRRRRYETASAVAADIDSHLAGLPVVAAPPTLGYRLQKFTRRHRLTLASAASFILLLATGAVVSTFEALRADRNAVEARSQATRASEFAQRETRQRERAEQLAEQNRRNLYAARINVAQKAYEHGDVTRLGELLESIRPQPGEDDLRGFEWRYLWRLAHSEQLLLQAGGSRLRAVAFPPDGRLIATAGEDGKARLWDAASGKSLAVLVETNGFLKAVAFSPDGNTLATGGMGGVVRVWDVATRRVRASLTRLPEDVGAIAFSPDGRWLAASSAILKVKWYNQATRFVSLDTFDAMVKVWNAVTLEELSQFKAQEKEILSLAFSADGETLATASADQCLKLWQMPSGVMRTSVSNLDEYAFAVALSPDGTTLAVGGGYPWDQKAMLKLWDVRTASWLRSLTGSRGTVLSLAFAPDGQTLASAGLDPVVRLWDVHSGNERAALRGHTEAVWSVAFDPTGRRVASCGWDGTARVWDTLAPQNVEIITNADAYSLAFSPDGKRLAAGGTHVHLIDLDTRTTTTLPGYSNDDVICAFSPDGKLLAAAGMNGVVTLWDTSSWTKIADLKGDGAKVWGFAFSPDSRTLAAGSEGTNANVRFWDVASQHERFAIRLPSSKEARCDFTPDGRSLLARSWDELISLDPATGTVQWSVKGAAPFGALTPDGRWLAITEGSQRIRLMNLQTRETRWTIQAHRDIIFCLAISPDGKTLASSSWDGTAKLWNITTGQEMFSYSAPSVAWSTAFSPDGTWWAVGSGTHRGSQVALFRAATTAQSEAADRVENARLLRGRAESDARHGRWKEAAANLTKAMELDPADDWSWYYLAPLLIEAGDVPGYRKHCHAMLMRVSVTSDVPVVRRAAKACLLLPTSGADLARASNLADAALAEEHEWLGITKGLAEYRQGRFASAVEWARKSLSQSKADRRSAQAFLILAMAYHQLGQVDRSRNALDRGNEIVRNDVETGKDSDLGADWQDWLTNRILLREVAALLERASATEVK